MLLTLRVILSSSLCWRAWRCTVLSCSTRARSACSVAMRAKQGDPLLHSAPHFAPRRRLDETLAARKPVLVWTEPVVEQAEAAE